MTEPIEKLSKEKISLFWSILIVVGANIIIACALFVPFIYSWHVLGALGLLNSLLIFFVFIGMKRHERVKDKDFSATTFSRKMFNIISGLIFAFFIWLFSPFLALFILLGIDFAFSFHEIAYVVFKSKTYFTDALNALGRQSDLFKPYLSSIMALLGFSIALGFQTIIFQLYAIKFAPLTYGFVVIIVFIATILIWALSDTVAYFVGTYYGKHKLPYNKKKSFEGFFANMAVGIGLGFFFFNPLVLPFISSFWWIFLSIIGGITSAFFESVDLHLDDNFITVTFTGIILGTLIILV
ncbi:MAG: hypothetical protein ACFFD2_13600 [Promethearchaeota archaeon]